MTCFECGCDNADHEHHVVPKSKGGTKTVALCGYCHSKIHGEHLMLTSSLTRLALRRKKLNGERVGTIPFGYDLADDGVSLVENKDEQAVLRAIRHMRHAGFTLRQIAEELSANGIRTKSGSDQWQHTTIRRLTHCEAENG